MRLIQQARAPPSALDVKKSREFALFVLSLDRKKNCITQVLTPLGALGENFQ